MALGILPKGNNISWFLSWLSGIACFESGRRGEGNLRAVSPTDLKASSSAFCAR